VAALSGVAAAQQGEARLVGYDRRWAAAFQGERRMIAAVLGSRAAAIEHVGSSSVAGLAGRSEIDILVGVRRAARIEQCARLMNRIGYVTSTESSRDGWCLMTKAGPIPIEALLVEHLSPLWNRHLFFRDYLRADPRKASEYERLKSQWAARYGVGTEGYKKAKQQYWIAIGESAVARSSTSALTQGR
jgi:GrpB-like predicted nucleotidyltransferase (UPF0157 family)